MNCQTYKNPICEGADPFVLLHDGVYYKYATNSVIDGFASLDGFKVARSYDLVNWEDMGYCLKKGDVIGEDRFWAPEVMYHNGKFYMIYTASLHIAVAVSTSPLGPFKQQYKKWLIETPAIDGPTNKDINFQIKKQKTSLD